MKKYCIHFITITTSLHMIHLMIYYYTRYNLTTECSHNFHIQRPHPLTSINIDKSFDHLHASGIWSPDPIFYVYKNDGKWELPNQ